MDLVASYDSEHGEDSDIEEVKASRQASKTNKNVDVIDLESDSEDETTSQSDNTKVSSENSSLNRTKKANCGDITEKVTAPNSVPKILPGESCTTTSDSTDKKTDYLNLESSDSDLEAEPIGDKVDTLINSASILSEVPCGPEKLSELPSQSLKRSIDNDTISNRSAQRSVLTSNINLNTADSCVIGDIKRYKTDLCTEIKQFKNEISKCGAEETDSCLLKEDERVIEASQKNIVCRVPRNIVHTNIAHSNIILSLNWCIPKYSHLYLTASLDGCVKIWDLYRRNPAQCISVASGLSAAKWSLDGGQICAGGIGKKAYVFDVQTGKRVIEYEIFNFITSIEVHPYMEDVFLCGTRNAILGFDMRVNTNFPIRSFFSNCKEVLDIAFLDENEFICSTNIVSHDSADRTIMVWDFSSGSILSNQIYLERYTCPSIKVHPTDSSFVAQTNGDYIASFSTARPYKLKNKRYMGHKVSGYGIECDISPDGKYLGSGDAEGGVYFYNYASCANVFKSTVKKNCPTNKLKWHPAFPSTVITASYDGQIQIWK